MSQPAQNKLESASVWRCDVSVSNQTDARERLAERLAEQMLLLEWAEKDVFDVQIAFEEALTNAVVHGNHSDPLKLVHVQCLVTAAEVCLSMRDEGTGFNPEDVPDPRHPDNLHTPSGRGIMLIRHFMDKVEFTPSGNVVTMTKYRKTQSQRL
ncbi:MAG: ATP-binding protein [Planctomycetaceae bacterium]|jgi:serine/threonine-protein kinase RsbW|nr:ATP-binding protein [Planctomycetaceae bacterium]